MELNGAVAVVTGASSGFGELTALRFAREGATVVVAARRAERLKALAGRIEAGGGRAHPVRVDVADPASIIALRDDVATVFGRCDVLVNNAGIPGGGRFEGLSFDEIERVVRVNLVGVMECTGAFLPMMIEARVGHIVNVASLAGRFAAPGASVYSATKHGVVAFSEALFHEVALHRVLVTCVNPIFSPTEGFPQDGRRRPFVVPPERVARTIVDVVKRGRAPEVSIPRWAGALQAFRVLTPIAYRWGVRKATGAGIGARGAWE